MLQSGLEQKENWPESECLILGHSVPAVWIGHSKLLQGFQL